MMRVNAMNIRAKYSGGPKTTAKSARSGAKKVRPTRPSVPAKKDEMAEMARAGPALPSLGHFIAVYGSRHGGKPPPGMLTTIAVVDPPYMAP